MSRIACRFSCGAASAVAAKLILAEYPKDQVVIINAYIKEEHPDNRRFLADCQVWFDHPIMVLRDDKYGASTHEVFRRVRFMSSRQGAPCSQRLKRNLLDAWRKPEDVMVGGFTSEEQERFDDMCERFPNDKVRAPLIEKGLDKAACLAIIERAGLVLPMMYRMGYNNANCIGCVKGGEGYWNKIRRDFPDSVERAAKIQDELGPGSYLFRNRKTGVRFSLRELNPASGRHKELLPDCDVFCESAEQEIETPAARAKGDSP